MFNIGVGEFDELCRLAKKKRLSCVALSDDMGAIEIAGKTATCEACGENILVCKDGTLYCACLREFEK